MPVSEEQLERCVEILRGYGATKIVLFGSILETPDDVRDLDLACKGIEGWEFFRAAAELEDVVDLPVDLVPLDVDARMTRHIEKWGRVLYESSEAA